jgi:hypothetical protein
MALPLLMLLPVLLLLPSPPQVPAIEKKQVSRTPIMSFLIGMFSVSVRGAASGLPREMTAHPHASSVPLEASESDAMRKGSARIQLRAVLAGALPAPERAPAQRDR